MDAVLERFVAKSPMAVAVRGAFEYALAPAPLDDLFVRTVGHRDDRELLFSTCVDLMANVVCRVQPSIHAACQAEDHLPVNVTAVYARLARVPATAGRDLVRHTAERLGPVIRAMGGAVPDPLPGYRVKVLDGNHLGKTHRRLKPLRDVAAGPLPGQTLVVLDPALGLAIDVVCCEDAHAQERSLLDPILETVADRDVWVADRNFCTTGFLFGIAGRRGSFVIRRHATTLSWDRESDWVSAGRTDTGTLSEQTIWLTEPGGTELAVRRVRLTLDRPTRDGDGVIEVLTNLPAEVAVAAVVAELYRGRWSVEGLFLRLTTVLKCEVNALGYPPAALFGFCVALAAGNVYAAVKAAVRAAHGAAVADGVSDYHLAVEVSGVCPGLWIAIPVEVWAEMGAWTVGRMAEWLMGLARGANLGRYRKATRGPKKPSPPRTRFAEAKHIATSRLLNGEQT
ncbi:transposase family protein : Transposase IS4 family protein OS=Cyanothece sp. (strain PCC 7822) GN=Cyan7822_1129 PE=4 SV=1 [Gemmataceae bacterium]|nr:Transposase IS4 family protein OS=Cyanothece sp. (strain PCC 7822) GN=Cyan7822_1129 PE=4 SV=1 [Gemmataceae bacterium]VIP10888.1 transposase family protein : Transposase IS4 family protein OS=Cyanothece sp. (strain PCC 7822) GN=Cyan7822_1129 PE=4 SV=1 [Gemmataceae bacterium]VTT98803.1 Transposase IS4 family protein OS=Cyanothece sp. (strain PCC 7822) GN=Cyan7822_1129 PE=4 SV=1 [Gemmataceae bacterium]VTU00907.1 transposase family protein : Transposase IS4 family protein OS=Cyanothece sp. (strai